MMNVNDIVISSQTGSGKTLAYLMPTIDGMNFVGRGMLQLLVIVPTRELVVQNAMLIWRILGGNVSRQMPGDTANIFRYIGPRGVKVKGVFRFRKARALIPTPIRLHRGNCRRNSRRVERSQAAG